MSLLGRLFDRKSRAGKSGLPTPAMSGHQVIVEPLDRRFRGRVVVTEASFAALREAYDLDTASTVPGVLSALKTLGDRVDRGETLWLFNPATATEQQVDDPYAFRAWAIGHFPLSKAVLTR